MKAFPWCFVVLLFAVSCGRQPPPTLFGAEQDVIFRVIAKWDIDAGIAEAAQDTEGRFVVIEDRVSAEWVPISDSVVLDGKQVVNAVTRRTASGAEVLVLHTENDISEQEIAAVEGSQGDASREHTVVTLTGAGMRRMFQFTLLNRGRAVAVVADGKVLACPLIVSPVSSVMILTPEEIDKVRLRDQ